MICSQILAKRQFNLGPYIGSILLDSHKRGGHSLWAALMAFITWTEAQKFSSIGYRRGVCFTDLDAL